MKISHKVMMFLFIITSLPILVNAQTDQTWNDLLGFLLSFGAWVLFLVSGAVFIIIALMVAPHFTRVSRSFFWLGTFLIVLAIFFSEFAYVFPLLKQEEITYEKCEKVVTGDVLTTAACIIVGYAPSGGIGTTQVTFWITGVIIPLFILIYIFYDFVKASEMIRDENSQKVIAFGFAFLAFRGFLASRFITFLSYGLFGIALLLINLIIAGGLLGFGNRFFQRWAVKEVEREVRSSMKVSKEVVKQFCSLLQNAGDPAGYFNSESPHMRAYFDSLGLHNEFNLLSAYASQNRGDDIKRLAEDLSKRL
ncbi:MAG: hypothetical protein QXL86_00800 [Candidatus Aenigmatarchaeota archaeon]